MYKNLSQACKFLIILLPIILLEDVVRAQTISTYAGVAEYKFKFNFSPSGSDTLKASLFFNNFGDSYYKAENQIRIKTQSNYPTKEGDVEKIINDSTVIGRKTQSFEQIYLKRSFTLSKYILDSLKTIPWQLLSERRKIGKFLCYKAQGRVSGRDYVAWYTLQVPVGKGPWKLYGLPGLIIEAHEVNGVASFWLVSINMPLDKPVLVLIDNIKRHAIPKAEFTKLADKELERRKSFAESMGVKLSVRRNNQGLEIDEN